MIVAILCDHSQNANHHIMMMLMRFNRFPKILIKNKFKKLFVTFAANVD